MAETLVENKVCEACGADVRSGSLFCYNCGGAVSLDLPESGKKNNKKDVNDAKFQSDVSEKSDLKTTRLKKENVENIESKPIEKPLENLSVGELLEKLDEKTIEKPTIQEDAKLKSAANMRRKTKSFQKKKVEIIWEEPENSPNKWFPIVAVLLILFVVAIFYLAMYLR